jgi:hypothetical protein
MKLAGESLSGESFREALAGIEARYFLPISSCP